MVNLHCTEPDERHAHRQTRHTQSPQSKQKLNYLPRISFTVGLGINKMGPF